MGVAYGPTSVTDGLVLALDAGNIKSYSGSGTTIYDLAKYQSGVVGSLTNGPTYSSGDKGQIVFDGVDDYINISTNASNSFGSKAITVMTVAKVSSAVSKNTLLSFNGTFNFFLPGTRLTGTTALQQLYWDSVSSWRGGNTTSFNTNQWYHLTWTIDAEKNILFYINGVLDYTNTIATDFAPTADAAVRVGFANAGEYATGNISMVQVYNIALTAVQIQQNFNAVRGRYGL